jgi:Baseplate J-like protein
MSLPIPNLDDREFDRLIQEALKLIPIHAPRWTDHNLHDPGITLIDLLAWLTEMQLYNLNQVTDRHLSKYLALLGVEPSAATLPQVDVQLSAATFTAIPEGTNFYTQPSGAGTCFQGSESIEIIPLSIQKAISYSDYRYIDVTQFNRQVHSYYHAFGETPSPGDALYLGFQSDFAPDDLEGKTLRLHIVAYEEDLPQTGSGNTVGSETALLDFPVSPSAQVRWEYWNGSQWQALSIDSSTETIPVLSTQGPINLLLPSGLHQGTPTVFPGSIADTGGLFWIRCHLVQAEYELPPRIDRILPNVVPTVGKQTPQDQTGNATDIGGTIPEGTLNYCDIPGITVTNPYPSTPGQAAESIDDAFLRTGKDLDIPCTATTAADYEYIAKATPGLRVARAKAVIAVGNVNHVTVAVVPYSFGEKPLPGTGFKQTVCRYLDRHRPVTTKISICDPDYVKVWANVTVTLKSSFQPDQVSLRIEEALNLFLSPLANNDNNDGWPFGRPVYHSKILQLLENVPGINCITDLTLYADAMEGIWEKQEKNILVGKLSLVYPGTHQINVNDPYRQCKQT